MREGFGIQQLVSKQRSRHQSTVNSTPSSRRSRLSWRNSFCDLRRKQGKSQSKFLNSGGELPARVELSAKVETSAKFRQPKFEASNWHQNFATNSAQVVVASINTSLGKVFRKMSKNHRVKSDYRHISVVECVLSGGGTRQSLSFYKLSPRLSRELGFIKSYSRFDGFEIKSGNSHGFKRSRNEFPCSAVGVTAIFQRKMEKKRKFKKWFPKDFNFPFIAAGNCWSALWMETHRDWTFFMLRNRSQNFHPNTSESSFRCSFGNIYGRFRWLLVKSKRLDWFCHLSARPDTPRALLVT